MSSKTDHSFNQQDLIKLYRRALIDGFPLDKLETKISKFVARSSITKEREEQIDDERNKGLANHIPKLLRIGAAMVPLVFIVVGLLLVGSATMPILGFYINNLPFLKENKLSAPIPQTQVLDVSPLVIATTQLEGDDLLGEKIEEDSGPIMMNTALDYTNLSSWFEGESLPKFQTSALSKEEEIEYRLDIPSLKIENAIVKVGGEDLNSNLIQYPGTALPGKLGAPVIFGHSVLRQFYNPKESNSRRYNSIFSTIMTLKKGDKIYVTVDNVKYTYVVQEHTEVKPEDTYILSQRYDVRQLKLVTCTPEGTYLRRGVVTASLVKE